MVKKLLAVLIVISVVMFSSGSIFAENVSLGDKINLGVNCSVVIPTEDEAGTGVYVGGLLSYDILKYLAVGIESGYLQSDIRQEIYGISIKTGTLRGAPLLGDIIVKAPIEMDKFTLTPYGIVGIGVLFSDFAESGIVKDIGASIKTDTAFAMKFGGGIDFYVIKNIALNFEASYLMADVDYSENWRGQTMATDTFKAGSCFLGGGVKVRF